MCSTALFCPGVVWIEAYAAAPPAINTIAMARSMFGGGRWWWWLMRL